MKKDEVLRLVDECGLTRVKAQIEGHILPAIRVETQPIAEDRMPVGASKIGGCPDLPEGVAWPAWNGVPLSFLAQVRLEDVAALDAEHVLPESGLLLFFYDPYQEAWGFDPKDKGRSRVLYAAAAEPLRRAAVPPVMVDGGRFNPCSVGFSSILTIPDSGSRQAVAMKLKYTSPDDPAEQGQYFNLHERMKEAQKAASGHWLLGHPDPVQNEMQLECQLVTNGIYCGDATRDPRSKDLEEGADDWRLLFQVDTDDNAAMMWGDLGKVYFWIRRQDLAARAFDRTWAILQCG